MTATTYPDAPGLKELILGKDCDNIGGFATVELISPGPGGPHVSQRMRAYVHKRHSGHNLVVNSGKVQLWRLAMGLQLNLFDQFRIGTSAAAAASGDTNVKSPVASSLVTADSMSVLAATRTAEWVVSYPSGVGTISAASIQEVCLLNQNTSPGGSAMMRALFPPLTKTLGDKLRITYQSRIA